MVVFCTKEEVTYSDYDQKRWAKRWEINTKTATNMNMIK